MPSVNDGLSNTLLALIAQLNEASGISERGNIDLTHRPLVRNGGMTSTVRSVSFTLPDGRVVLVPTVVGGRIVGDREALNHYYRTGQHLGIFKNNAAAERYADTLHRQQAMLYAGRL